MERGARPARPHRCSLCCRAECQEQVNKFPSASFKKFATEKDAWTFVRSGLPGPQQQQPEPAGPEGEGEGGGRCSAGGSGQARRLCQRCGCSRNAGTSPVHPSPLAQRRGDGLRARPWMCQCTGRVSVGVWRALLAPC